MNSKIMILLHLITFLAQKAITHQVTYRQYDRNIDLENKNINVFKNNF